MTDCNHLKKKVKRQKHISSTGDLPFSMKLWMAMNPSAGGVEEYHQSKDEEWWRAWIPRCFIQQLRWWCHSVKDLEKCAGQVFRHNFILKFQWSRAKTMLCSPLYNYLWLPGISLRKHRWHTGVAVMQELKRLPLQLLTAALFWAFHTHTLPQRGANFLTCGPQRVLKFEFRPGEQQMIRGIMWTNIMTCQSHFRKGFLL